MVINTKVIINISNKQSGLFKGQSGLHLHIALPIFILRNIFEFNDSGKPVILYVPES